MTALTYPDFTPPAKFDGGGSYPVPFRGQMVDVRAHLETLLETCPDREAGVQVIVRWSGTEPTLVRRWDERYEGGGGRVYGFPHLVELDPNTGAEIRRTMEWEAEHWASLTKLYGTKPYDRIPKSREQIAHEMEAASRRGKKETE